MSQRPQTAPGARYPGQTDRLAPDAPPRPYVFASLLQIDPVLPGTMPDARRAANLQSSSGAATASNTPCCARRTVALSGGRRVSQPHYSDYFQTPSITAAALKQCELKVPSASSMYGVASGGSFAAE